MKDENAIEELRSLWERMGQIFVTLDMTAQAKPSTKIYDFAKEVLKRKTQYENGIRDFNIKELKRMPKDFISQLKNGKSTKILRQRDNGVYELRATYRGVSVSASSKDIDAAIEKFIDKLIEIRKGNGKPVRFIDFAEEWLENYKKPFVEDVTYKNEQILMRLHIKPFIGERTFAELSPMILQPLFSSSMLEKPRAAQKAKQLLNQIFEAAVHEDIITKNPMRGVKLLRHEYAKGNALTIAEERQLLEDIKDANCRLDIIFLLYTGIRRGELVTAEIGEDFITVQNGKRRKGQRPTIRKIPITPMLRPYINELRTSPLFRARCSDNLTRDFKVYCPNHHLHELRHTFISRAQECGVSRELVSVWAGHTADNTMTTTVYTHFSDEFMLSEAEKIKY